MDDLAKLKEKYAGCKRCSDLVANRTNVVFGTGNKDCRVLIIGEAPGKNEDEKNEPFIGRSGQLLNGLLEEIGLTRSDIYITNTVLCRPPENRNPTKIELNNCKDRLDEQISILNPDVVITLGNFATKYMLDTKEGITKLRGKVFEKEVNDRMVKVVPIQHPAVLLYNGNSSKKRAEFQADFKVVKKLLN